MRAKKSLGQHFLTSQKALREIITAASIQPSDTVLEIGPGTGILTEELLKSAKQVIAIEKDRELIIPLHERFVGRPLTIIEQDILLFEPATIKTPYRLVANIPYYITGAIIEKFLSTEQQPHHMVLLIQKEVAERIVAKNNKESVLSISVKVYGTPRIVARVPAGAFNPPPRVDSAILSIEHISKDFFNDCDEASFFMLLKFIFGKKRGQIGGRLASYINDKERAVSILLSININPKARPENLTPLDWKRLVQKLVY